MSVKRSGLQSGQDLAFTVRARSIGCSELAFVQSAIADSAPDWSVELQGICSDEAALVLLPEDGDDDAGPSFLVSRETCGFRVDQVHWDVITEVGVYTTMAEVADILRLRIGFYNGIEVPSSRTIH